MKRFFAYFFSSGIITVIGAVVVVVDVEVAIGVLLLGLLGFVLSLSVLIHWLLESQKTLKKQLLYHSPNP